MERSGSLILNWKPYYTVEERILKLNQALESLEADQKIYVALSYSDLQIIPPQIKDERIIYGINHLNPAGSSTFTGPIATKLAKNAGAQFVLINPESFANHPKVADRRAKLISTIESGLVPFVFLNDDDALIDRLKELFKDLNLQQLERVNLIIRGKWILDPNMELTEAEKLKEILKVKYSLLNLFSQAALDSMEFFREIAPFSNEETMASSEEVSGFYTDKGVITPEIIPFLNKLCSAIRVKTPLKVPVSEIDMKNIVKGVPENDLAKQDDIGVVIPVSPPATEAVVNETPPPEPDPEPTPQVTEMLDIDPPTPVVDREMKVSTLTNFIPKS